MPEMSFRSYASEWLDSQVYGPGTVEIVRLVIKHATFTDKRMSAILVSHVQGWVKSMVVAGLMPSTIAMRYRYARIVFAAAVRDKVIPVDPTIGVTLPRQRRAEAAMTIPTPEQMGLIMAAADDWFRPFIGLCAFAGLRLGEAAAIKKGDVHFLKKTLQVSRQVQRGGPDGVRICPPKYGSERMVYPPQELLDMLTRHIEVIGVRPEGWLFWGRRGNPPHQNTIGRHWRNTLVRAGLGHYEDGEWVSDFTLHDLRHFYASGLIAAGCDPVTVQRALGHHSAAFTLKVYAHLWPTAKDKTSKAASAMFQSSVEAGADSVRTDLDLESA